MLLPRARCVALLGLSSSLRWVNQAHAQLVTNGLAREPNAAAKLIERYFAVPGGAGIARLVFCRFADDMFDERALLAWNAMLRCCEPKEALLLFAHEIIRKRVPKPDKFTYTYVLRACANLKTLQEGRQIHAQIVKAGLVSEMAIGTTGIHFYASCEDVGAARKMFEEMPVKSSVTWNSLMTGYCTNGFAKEATVLFAEMRQEGVKPTERTAVLLLSACSQLGDLGLGSSVHACVSKIIGGSEDCVFIGTGLVDLYSKCGCLSSALKLFERMKQRNVLTWSAMMAGLARHGQGKRAMEMLDEMENDSITPNAVTFTSLLSACCHAGLVGQGLHLFDSLPHRFGIEPCMQHYGCAVDLLGRAGMVEEAHDLVQRMPVRPDPIVWRALLSACNIHGHTKLGEDVGKILLQLEQASSPTSSSTPEACQDYVALSNVYASAERWEDVFTLRQEMKSNGVHNRPGCSSIPTK